MKHITRGGGWSGFRAFTVIDKVRESDEITSFYLSPKNGGSCQAFYLANMSVYEFPSRSLPVLLSGNIVCLTPRLNPIGELA